MLDSEHRTGTIGRQTLNPLKNLPSHQQTMTTAFRPEASEAAASIPGEQADRSSFPFQDSAGDSRNTERNIRNAELQRINASSSSSLPELNLFDSEDVGQGKAAQDTQPLIAQDPESKVQGSDDPTFFEFLDKDGDKHLSEEELEAASNDERLGSDERNFVNVLKKHQDEIEELSNDETGDENDGITQEDIKALDQIRDIKNMKQYGLNNFNVLDKDKDGHLSEDDLDEALKSEDLTDRDREMIEALRARLDEIEDASNDELGFENDGMTKKDLRAFENDSELAELIRDFENALF